jgi:hypothetical protein
MPLDFPEQDAHNATSRATHSSGTADTDGRARMHLLLQTTLTDERNLPLIGVGMLALAYVVLRPMMKRKRDPLERNVIQSSMAQQRAVERQMQNLLVDLSEMARQISGQLDTRAARLQALLEQADQRIAQLRQLTGATGFDSSHSGSNPPSAANEATASAPVSVASPMHAEVYALADEGRGAKEIAAQLNRPSGEIELILALRTPRG